MSQSTNNSENESVVCKYCGRSFDTPRALAAHKGNKHQDKIDVDADEFDEPEIQAIEKAADNSERRLVALDTDTVEHAERYLTLVDDQLDHTPTEAIITAARYGFLNQAEAFGFEQMVDIDDPTRDAQAIVNRVVNDEAQFAWCLTCEQAFNQAEAQAIARGDEQEEDRWQCPDCGEWTRAPKSD